MTNLEKIKEMSVEKMAEFLDCAIDASCHNCCNNYDNCIKSKINEDVCKKYYLEWLKAVAKTE